jgi:rRNA-processing protein FCF1
MAKWVSQSVASSVSNNARNRTRYLQPLVPEIHEVIRRYFANRPEGEDVTLEVLKAIGRDKVDALRGEQKFDRAKQDVGLLVAICLVDLYGPARVLTFREDDGKAVSTRAAKRSGLDWVSRFTPHRVLPERSPDRIVLDTNVVRYIIQGSPNPENVLDLVELHRLKGKHSVSLADPAWAELVEALVRPQGGLSITEWGQRVSALRTVLDADLPIVPTGRELAALSGLVHSPGFNAPQMAAYYRALWEYSSGAASAGDLLKPYDYEAPDGKRYRLGPLDPSRPIAVFTKRGEGWSAFIAKVARSAKPLDLDETVELIRADLAKDMEMTAVDRLSLLVHAVAHYMVKTTQPGKPYIADLNDVVDLDILSTATLPAVVCTTDKGLRNLARQSGSSDGWRVMTPVELLDWLQAESLTGTTVA